MLHKAFISCVITVGCHNYSYPHGPFEVWVLQIERLARLDLWNTFLALVWAVKTQCKMTEALGRDPSVTLLKSF